MVWESFICYPCDNHLGIPGMHGKVTKYGGPISTWKWLIYKVNSVGLTSERKTNKKGNPFLDEWPGCRS